MAHITRIKSKAGGGKKEEKGKIKKAKRRVIRKR